MDNIPTVWMLLMINCLTINQILFSNGQIMLKSIPKNGKRDGLTRSGMKMGIQSRREL